VFLQPLAKLGLFKLVAAMLVATVATASGFRFFLRERLLRTDIYAQAKYAFIQPKSLFII
jgi:hypothetical protein